MAPAFSIAIVSILLSIVDGYAIRTPPRGLENDTSSAYLNVIPELVKRAADPTDFAWVHRLAAIGDSFTAGIGAGQGVSDVHENYEDYRCSRYDQSYPMVVNNIIGPSITDFQASRNSCADIP